MYFSAFFLSEELKKELGKIYDILLLLIPFKMTCSTFNAALLFVCVPCTGRPFSCVSISSTLIFWCWDSSILILFIFVSLVRKIFKIKKICAVHYYQDNMSYKIILSIYFDLNFELLIFF